MQQVSYQSYTKHRKPFLTTYYPFLTPNQINAKLRQEYASLNCTKAKTKTTKSSHSHTHNRSQSPSLSKSKSKSKSHQGSSRQTCYSPSFLSEKWNDDGEIPRPPLTPQPCDQQYFDDNDDDDDDDDDIGSPYQRNKSKIDQLNRSAFSSSSSFAQPQRYPQNRTRQSFEEDCDSATTKSTKRKPRLGLSSENSKTKRKSDFSYGDEIEEGFSQCFDEDDYRDNRCRRKSKIKDYSGNVFKLDHPVPAIEFDDERNDDSSTEMAPSILKNSGLTFIKQDSATPKSKVRFSHLTTEHHQNSTKLSNSKSKLYTHDDCKTKSENCNNKNKMLKQAAIPSENRYNLSTVSNNNSYDFDDNIDNSYEHCSYSTFKKESSLNSSYSKEVKGSSLPKSKSTSLLQNTISACSKMIKKNRRSLQSKKCKSVNENLTKGFSASSQHVPSATKSKSWQRSPAMTKQNFSPKKVVAFNESDYNYNFEKDDSSVYSDDENAALMIRKDNQNSKLETSSSKVTPTNQTKRPCSKETSSSKKLTPLSIVRQLRSVSKQLSATKTKLLSPKSKLQEKSKTNQSSSSKNRLPFSRSKSDSNVRDAFGFDEDIDAGLVVQQNRRLELKKPHKSLTPSNTSRQLWTQDMSTTTKSAPNSIRRLRSTSTLLSNGSISKYPGSSETLKMPSSCKKVVSFYDRHSDTKQNFNVRNDNERTATFTRQDITPSSNGLEEPRKTVTPRHKTSSRIKDVSLDNEMTPSTTTRLLRSASKQLSAIKSLNSNNDMSRYHDSKSMLTSTSEEISKFNDESDFEDHASYCSDDENAALIVRHSQEFENEKADESDYNFHKSEDENDSEEQEYISKDNSRKLKALNDYCNNYSEQNTVVTKDKYYDYDEENQSMSDEEANCWEDSQKQNLNYSATLCSNGYNDSDDSSVCEKTKITPKPAPRKSKRKPKEYSKNGSSCVNVSKPKSDSFYSEMLNSNSRQPIANKSNDDRRESFQWEDDGDLEDCNVEQIQYRVNTKQHRIGENQSIERRVKSKRHDETSDNIHQMMSNGLNREFVVEKHERRNGDYDNVKQRSSVHHLTKSTHFESFHQDDDNNDSDNESDNDDAFGELSGNYNKNENILVSYTNDDDEEEDVEDDDDENAFFTSKMACQTHDVLSGALRRIHSMQYAASEFVPTVCSNTEDMRSLCSNTNDYDNDDSDGDNDDDVTMAHTTSSNNSNWRSRQQQGMGGDFTLTDLFDDTPHRSNRRQQVDALGMARRMFQSSRIENCSNFGSLFDDEDIFV